MTAQHFLESRVQRIMEARLSKAAETAESGEFRFGVGLQARRLAAGLTQRQLAEISGCKLQSVRQWEQGRFWPGSRILPALAQACRCSIEELYYAPEDEPDPAPADEFGGGDP